MSGARIASLVLAATVLAIAPARAAVLIVETERPLAGGGEPRTTRIYLDGSRVRVETSATAGKQAFVFLADRQLFWTIDYDRKKYTEMTKQDFERMISQAGDAMARARAQMEEQMKQMPPEQRAIIEKMMKQSMGAVTQGVAEGPPTVYTKVAAGERVGQWTADRYEGRAGGEKEWDVWTVDWQQIGLTAADMTSLEQLGAFFASAAKMLAKNAPAGLFTVGSPEFERAQGYAGVPVRRISYEEGRPQRQFDITETKQETFAASLFQVPEGFQKEALPRMQP